MEGYRQRMSELYESSGSLAVDASIFLKYAENDAVEAEVFAGAYIAAHFFQVVLGITEIASARPDQNMDGNANFAASGSNQGIAGRNSSARQVRAEFNTVSAGTFGRDGMLQRLHADFQGTRVRHQ